MNKPDYNKRMREETSRAPKGARLLLHSCCGPCSTRCIETLKETFGVTVLFYNPNITDSAEYEKRKGEQARFLKQTGWAHLAPAPYEPQAFFAAAKGLENEREGGARCYRCFALRLEYTARRAAEEKFDYFCTTLSVSPHKNAAWLNELGERFAEEYKVRFLPSDFKKENGYLRSVKLAEEYGLYRQNYCGCAFSKRL